MQSFVYAIGMRARFRGILVREGMLLRSGDGWGEFCPFAEYSDAESAPWLAAALESAAGDWPAPVRTAIPVNCTVPVLSAEQAHALVRESGCATAKVKVADPRATLDEDCERVTAVRDALGPGGAIRVDANMAWTPDEAVAAITRLDRAAHGLEYAEQPCRSIPELAQVRRRVDVRIAADESIRRAEDPLRVAVAEAADVAVLKVAPLGGVRRALQVAEACGLPCVVSSALETGVGMAAGLALAAALPELDFACGLGTTSLLAGDVLAEPYLPVRGWLPVPRSAPAPDPELLRRHAADEQRAAWWQQRYDRLTTPGAFSA